MTNTGGANQDKKSEGRGSNLSLAEDFYFAKITSISAPLCLFHHPCVSWLIYLILMYLWTDVVDWIE